MNLSKTRMFVGSAFIITGIAIFWFTRPSPLQRALVEDGKIEFLTLCAFPCEEGMGEGTGEKLDGYEILDSLIIDDPSLIAEMANNLYRPGGDDAEYPECWWPRHAFRKVNDKKQYILICFECSQLRGALGGYWSGHANKAKEELFKRVAEDNGMKSPYEEYDALVESESK